MADHKIISCECGYHLRARTEQLQVAEVRQHAWEAHGVSFSTEEALALLLRIELEDGISAGLGTVDDTAQRKEKQ